MALQQAQMRMIRWTSGVKLTHGVKLTDTFTCNELRRLGTEDIITMLQ